MMIPKPTLEDAWLDPGVEGDDRAVRLRQ